MRYYGTKHSRISREVLAGILVRRLVPLEDLEKFGLLISKGKTFDDAFGERLCFDRRYISAMKAIMHELCKPIHHLFDYRRKPDRAA